MADVWGNAGHGMGALESEMWLYKKKGLIHGPVEQDQIVQSLIDGVLTPADVVTREGGEEFHPIQQVKAFAPYMSRVSAAAIRRQKKTQLKVVLISLLVLGTVLGGLGYFFQQQYTAKQAEAQAARQAEEDKLAAAREAKTKKLMDSEIAVVALVSLNDDDVKLPSKPTDKKNGGKRKSGKAGKKKTDSSGMSTFECQRTTKAEIAGPIRKAFAKINVCVNMEKTRDTQGLLPNTLILDYVIKPDGTVAGLRLPHRHFRTGPLNNCMQKAFKGVRYAKKQTAACPVQVPIKISK